MLLTHVHDVSPGISGIFRAAQVILFLSWFPASVCPHRFLFFEREPEEMELLTTTVMATKQRKEVNNKNLHCDLIEKIGYLRLNNRSLVHDVIQIIEGIMLDMITLRRMKRTEVWLRYAGHTSLLYSYFSAPCLLQIPPF